MRVEVKKSMLGRYTLKYDCPRCKAALTSPLHDAGKQDNCPDCGAVFAVPGSGEREKIRTADSAAAQQRDEQRELEQQRRREAAERKRMTAEIEKQRQDAVVAAAAELPKNRKCPFCAEEILWEANKCKHCGEFITAAQALKLAAKPKRPWYKSRRAKIATGIFLFAGFISVITDNHRTRRGGGGDSGGGNSIDIIYAAQRGVKSILKSPSTADFPSAPFQTNHYNIEPISGDTYRVTSYVDAQNSFGAKLRNHWEAIVKGSGSTWYAVSATITD